MTRRQKDIMKATIALGVFIIALLGWRLWPVQYEARCGFVSPVDRGMATPKGVEGLGNYQDVRDSIRRYFDDAKSESHRPRIVAKVLGGNYNASCARKEVESLITSAELEVRGNEFDPHFDIIVQHHDPALAADVANAFATTMQEFLKEENLLRCDKAVLQIHANVEKQRRRAKKLREELGKRGATAAEVSDLQREIEEAEQKQMQFTSEEAEVKKADEKNNVNIEIVSPAALPLRSVGKIWPSKN